MPQSIIGVDVAKDWIDIYWPASNKAARIETTSATCLLLPVVGGTGNEVIFPFGF